MSVDVHEIAPYVHFQHKTGASVVTTFFQDMLPQSFHTVMCASPFDTAVAVGYESALEYLVRVVVIKVMYYAVAESSSEDFTLFRVGYDETVRRERLVVSVPQLIAQRFDVLFKILLKTQLILLAALATPRLVIGRVQISEELGTGEFIAVQDIFMFEESSISLEY